MDVLGRVGSDRLLEAAIPMAPVHGCPHIPAQVQAFSSLELPTVPIPPCAVTKHARNPDPLRCAAALMATHHDTRKTGSSADGHVLLLPSTNATGAGWWRHEGGWPVHVCQLLVAWDGAGVCVVQRDQLHEQVGLCQAEQRVDEGKVGLIKLKLLLCDSRGLVRPTGGCKGWVQQHPYGCQQDRWRPFGRMLTVTWMTLGALLSLRQLCEQGLVACVEVATELV